MYIATGSQPNCIEKCLKRCCSFGMACYRRHQSFVASKARGLMGKMTPASGLVRFILVVTALLLPTLSLLPLGGLYLWEKGYLLWWAIAAFLCVAIVTAAHRILLGKPTAAGMDAEGDVPPPSATWSPLEKLAWGDVRSIAASANLEQISNPQAFLDLGLKTIEAVAYRLHPEKSDALWQFTLPEALTISERVSRRLAVSVTTHIPFGDSMTLAQFWAIYRWRSSLEVAERAYDVWRMLRFANPATALTHEARDRLSRALVQWGKEHVSRRIAETFVEEVGQAAIDLYGGRLKSPILEEGVENDRHAQGLLSDQTNSAGSNTAGKARRSRFHLPKQALLALFALGKSITKRGGSKNTLG
jgi:hypothetical protein